MLAQRNAPTQQHAYHDEDPADIESARLIAQLLAADLEDSISFQYAEEAQLALALEDSRAGRPSLPLKPQSQPRFNREREDDRIYSLRLNLAEVNSSIGHQTALELQERGMKSVADGVHARQFDLQNQARMKKEGIDLEFARSLEQTDRRGRHDIDDPRARDADAVLGAARIRELMRDPPAPVAQPNPPTSPLKRKGAPLPTPDPRRNRPDNNVNNNAQNQSHPLPTPDPRRRPGTTSNNDAKGKGKAVDQIVISPTPSPRTEIVLSRPVPILSTCFICMDPITLSSTPYESSKSASTSHKLQFGMAIGKAGDRHIGCIGCLTSYINGKLEDVTSAKVFPLKCPGLKCPFEITQDIATRILGVKAMEKWHYRMLLDASPPTFCPHKTCSARLLKNDDGNPQATCPSCERMICVECSVAWHSGYTCQAYQALPQRLKNPEDRSVYELATREGWKQCPSCKTMVELESGCFHMTCLCGKEFCYSCRSNWDKRANSCSKKNPCPLFSEENLLRARNQPARQPAVAPPPHQQQQQLQEQRQYQQQQQQRQHEQRQQQERREQQRRQQNEIEMRRSEEATARAVAAEERARHERAEQQRFEQQFFENQRTSNETANRMQALDFIVTSDQGSNHAFSNIFLQQNSCGYCNHMGFQYREDLQRHLADRLDHPLNVCIPCRKFFQCPAHLNQHLDSTMRNGQCHEHVISN